MKTTRVKRIGKSDQFKIEKLQEVSEEDGIRVEMWEIKTVQAKEDYPNICKRCPFKSY